MQLDLISAGAARGVVEAMAADFRRMQGATIVPTFGAVGAMKQRLLTGVACDAVVLTQGLLEELGGDGQVRAETLRPLGRVRTGVAGRAGDAGIALDTADALRNGLRAATSVYFPDPHLATAGIHFMNVLERLGLRHELAARLKPHPSGAAAMTGLAAATDARPIGCTQITEINHAPGVALLGALPRAFELATLYCAAVCTRASDPALAGRFVATVSGPETGALRAAAGFED